MVESIVGSLPIEHSVDPNGSLSLHVPIKVPPAKLSLEISVSYHSSITEMSVLGIGWDLQAFGLIQRTSATVAQDGFAGSINYDSDDRYTLNGQRLILVSENEYRYEVDQWSKVVAVGSDAANPDYWIEYLPDGNVQRYGSTSDSNLKAVGQSTTRIWALAETRDAFNNYTSYSYADDAGFLLLQSIDYGGNSNLSLNHQRKVTFSYGSRTDVPTEFVGGSAVTLNKRLTSISSSFNGTLVHTHTFDYGYAPVTGISRLKTITLSDASDASVLPLTFSWSDCAPSVFDQSVTLNSLPAATKETQILPVSVAGSGRTDLLVASKLYDHDKSTYVLNLDVYLADEKGTISTTPQPGSGPTNLDYPDQLLALDVDGDGRTDLLHIFRDLTKGEHILTVLLSTADKGYVPQEPVTFSPPVLDGTYYSGDFEGNGYVGLVYVYNGGIGGSSNISLKQFTSDGRTVSGHDPVKGPDDVDLNNVQVVIADFDGNGASDIFFMSPTFKGNGYVWRIDFFQSQKGYLQFRSDNPFDSIGAQIDAAEKSAFLGLPEQDGKTGFLLVSQNNESYLQYQTLRSTGKSFSLSDLRVTDLLYHGNIDISQSTSMTSLDLVNVVHLTDKTQVSVLHFFNGEFVDVKEVMQPPSLQDYDVHFVDLRGVGRTDCLFSFYNQLSETLELSSLPSAHAVAPADYIVGYTGGLGATLSVVYASLTDSTIYTQATSDSGPANPYVNAFSRVSSSHMAIDPSTQRVTSNVMGCTRTQLIRFPKYVIKQLTSCALPSAEPKVFSTAQYSYENARVAFNGRGWLGFETIVQTSDALGTATTNTYKQEFPFVGQMSKTETQDISGSDNPVKLKSTTYTWESHPTSHGTQCYTTIPSIQQTSYEQGKLLHSVNVAHDYDSYANVTQTKITTAGKPDLVISQTYNNDTDKWIIGSKLSESVTSNGSLMDQTSFTYLKDTQVVNQITKWVSDSSSTVENISFDAAGNVTKSAGPWQAQRTFAYDPTYTFPITVTTAVDEESSLTISASYDYGLGEIVTQTEPDGYVKAHQYDILGREIQISEGKSSDSLTVIEEREYTLLNGDAVCIRKTLCDLASQSWGSEMEYLDGMERGWKKAVLNVSGSPETVCSQLTFDGAGRIAREYRNYTDQTSNPVYIAYSYDGLSRKTKAVFPPIASGANPVTITYDYSCDDGETTITQTKSGDDQQGSTTTKAVLQYFPNHETGSHQFVVPLTVRSVDELDQAIVTAFDALHRVVSITDPKGICLSQEWDGISRIMSRKISNPGGSSINHLTFSHDDSSGTKTVTNQCTGSNIILQQDRLYRLTKRIAPDDETTYIYDDAEAGAQGRVSSITSSTGVSEAFSYDWRGCIQTSSVTIDEQMFTSTFEYTTSRQLSKITNPDKSILTRTFFDNSDIVKQVQLQDGSSETRVSSTFSRFDNGFFSPQVCDLGNGLTSTVDLADNGVPLKAVLSKDSSALLQQTWTLDSYSRLNTYNPSSSADTNRSFEYDFGGQLIRSRSSNTYTPNVEYKYDESGNIASKEGNTFVTDGWQLTSITDSSDNVISSFEYTADGHLSKEVDGSGKSVRTMTYDSLGRMTGVESTKFVYDSKGRMVKATTGDSVTYYPSTSYEVTVRENTTTQTAYLIHQSRGASISTDITSGKTGEPSVLYYHGDHLGSVIAVSDGNGDILTTYSYDDFGAATVKTGSDISRYKYSGKEAFEGLYYFGARFYSPVTGRFTTIDTIDLSLQDITASTFNQYAFSRNDPINFIDVNGNLSFWWHLMWHLVVDILLIAAGVAAAILLPAAPMLSQGLIGAGISGLQYDGEAAFNAVAFDQKYLNDGDWGISLGIGAVTGAIGGAGAGKAVGKLGEKIGAGRLFSTLGAKGLSGKYVLQQAEKGISKTIKTAAWGMAKSMAVGVGISTGLSVAGTMAGNLATDSNAWEGVGKAAAGGAVKGALGGAVGYGVNSLQVRTGGRVLDDPIYTWNHKEGRVDMNNHKSQNSWDSDLRRSNDSNHKTRFLIEGRSSLF